MSKKILIPSSLQDLKAYSFLVPNPNHPGINLINDYPDMSTGLIFNWRLKKFFRVEICQDFFTRFIKVPEEQRNFYEIIPEGPQKLHFIIDVKKDDVSPENFNIDFVDKFRDIVIETIHEYMINGLKDHCRKYPVFELFRDLMLFSFHQEDKFSYHIVIDNFIFPSSIHCQLITQQIFNRLPQDMTKFLNLEINKSNQEFQMVWNQKEGTQTINRKIFCTQWIYYGKQIIFEPRIFNDPRWNSTNPDLVNYLYFERSLISRFSPDRFFIEFPLADYVVQPKLNLNRIYQGNFSDIDQSRLEEMLPRGWTISHRNGNYFPLKSIDYPTCQICDCVHSNETQYLFVSPGQQVVYFQCNRDKSQSIRLGCLNPDYIDVLEYQNLSSVEIAKNGISETSPGFTVDNKNRKSYVLRANERYKNPYVKAITLVDNHITLIESYLGTGKTSAINNYIREKNPPRVLILSPRILFAMAIQNEYNCQKPHLLPFRGEKFVCYLDVKKELIANRLIVQMESLHRVSLDKPYDVLILDEVEALLSQFNADTLKLKIRCAKIFEKLIQTTPIIIGGDAFLSQRSVSVLSKLKPLYVIRNEFTPVKRKAIELPNWERLLSELMNSLSKNLKVVFVCGSKEKLKNFSNLCQQKNISHRIYSSDCRTHFDDLNDVNLNWSKVQCVGYTSSITVGINFDVPDYFDQIFVYGSTRACKARDTIQGTLRVRYLKQNVMYFATHNCPINSELPTKLQDVRDFIDRKIASYDRIVGNPTPPTLEPQIQVSSASEYFGLNTQEKPTEQKEKKSVLIFEREVDKFHGEYVWPIAPPWLKECFIYNFQEKNASAVYYRFVLISFLERSNYDMFTLNDSEFQDFTLTILSDKTRVNPETYSYMDIPQIKSVKEFEELRQKQKNGLATPGEKIMINRYYFDLNISKDLPLNARNEFFKLYFDDQKSRTIFYNLRDEKFSSPQEILGKELQNNYKDTSSLRSTKLGIMLSLNNFLKIENSACATNQILTSETVKNIFTPESLISVKEVFGIKCRIDDPDLHAIRCMAKAYESWTGLEVEYKRFQKMRYGKTIKTYKISKPSNDIWNALIDHRCLINSSEILSF